MVNLENYSYCRQYPRENVVGLRDHAGVHVHHRGQRWRRPYYFSNCQNRRDWRQRSRASVWTQSVHRVSEGEPQRRQPCGQGVSKWWWFWSAGFRDLLHYWRECRKCFHNQCWRYDIWSYAQFNSLLKRNFYSLTLYTMFSKLHLSATQFLTTGLIRVFPRRPCWPCFYSKKWGKNTTKSIELDLFSYINPCWFVIIGAQLDINVA